jgi:diketogulonate reductase-like aldo/keto reductase
MVFNAMSWVLSALSFSGSHHEPVRTTIIPSISIGVDVHGASVDMPLVGAGTWQYNDTVAYQSVCKAFAAGYTFVDTAFGYGNQKGVGRAIQDCWTGRREDLFVMTKIPGGLNASQVYAAHKQNLFELQLDYVDHLMTHFPADWQVTKASPALRQEEWLALERIYGYGEARSIGISHYCPQHIDDVLQVASVKPSINQVEYHIGSHDVDHVIQKCQENQITFMSFSPLCGPCKYEPEDSLIHGKLVSDIGKKYGVSGSQVSLRFIVQQALEGKMGGVIPKSNDVGHILLNRAVFSFKLDDEDMMRLAAASKPSPEAGDCDVP